MALILLAFIGTLAVFFRLWRELDGLRRSLGDIREMLQYVSVDASQQNRELANLARDLRALTNPQDAANGAAANDSLGELLEKGLPNLVGGAQTTEQAARYSMGPRDAAREEEDFLRRFEPLPSKESPS